MSKLDCLCTEGLLVDDTVEFKSFTSAFTHFVATHGGHSFALTCHCWSPICCNSTQLIPTKSRRVNCIWRNFKNIVTPLLFLEDSEDQGAPLSMQKSSSVPLKKLEAVWCPRHLCFHHTQLNWNQTLLTFRTFYFKCQPTTQRYPRNCLPGKAHVVNLINFLRENPWSGTL